MRKARTGHGEARSSRARHRRRGAASVERRRRAVLSSVGIALVALALAPVGAAAYCHGYEYEIGLQQLLSWPERGLYVANVTSAQGGEGPSSDWWFRDRDLRPANECPLDAKGEPTRKAGDAGPRTLGACADAVHRTLRAAAGAGAPTPSDGERFGAALVSIGARPLQLSTRCLEELAPCATSMAGRTWTCEVKRDPGTSELFHPLQSVGCFEDEGRRILLTAVAVGTGSDCRTSETWIRPLGAVGKDRCPECRTGFSSDGRSVLVPVLGLSPGPGPVFAPLGIGADGRLFFRYRSPSAPGGAGIGSFDPVGGALETRGVVAPAALRPLPSTAALPFGASFKEGTVTYTLLPAGPVDGRSNELEFAEGRAQPFRYWTVTLVSDRAGSQPFAQVFPPGVAWRLVVRSPASPHVTAVASVQTGGAIELGFFAAELRDGAFTPWKAPPPARAEDELLGRALLDAVIGFSRTSLVAYVPGDDPDGSVAIMRLTDDEVIAHEPRQEIAATLRRLGIVPGVLSPAWSVGVRFPEATSDDREYRVQCDGASVVLSRGEERKVLGRLAANEIDQGSDCEATFAISPFEPRAAVVVRTLTGVRVFGAHLFKGFKRR